MYVSNLSLLVSLPFPLSFPFLTYPRAYSPHIFLCEHTHPCKPSKQLTLVYGFSYTHRFDLPKHQTSDSILFELNCPNCIVWSTQAAAQKYDYKKMVWMLVFSCDIIRTPIITWLRSAMALFSASAPVHSFYVQVILQPYAAFWNEDRLGFVMLQISIYYSTLPFSSRIASCSCSFKPLYFFLLRRFFRPSLAPSSTTIRNSSRGLCTNYYDCAAWCICTGFGGRQRRPCRLGLLLYGFWWKTAPSLPLRIAAGVVC